MGGFCGSRDDSGGSDSYGSDFSCDLGDLMMIGTSVYKIECPPSYVGGLVTLCGESAGKSELTWTECPACGVGQAYGGVCYYCHIPRILKPQGFVGSSGQMLKRICSNAGIDFKKCNRTNVIKRMPSGGKFENMYLDPKDCEKPTVELQWWWSLLQAEITKNRPNVVVALGDEALYALTGHHGITSWAGSILDCQFLPGLKVIPMVHPAYIMRDNWADYYISIRFMKKVAAEMQSPRRILKEDEYIAITKPQIGQVLEFLEHIGSNHQPWDLDVETRGDTLTCLGLSSQADLNYCMVVPIHTTGGPYFSLEEECEFWRGLSVAMRDNPLLENQNVVYDLDYAMDFGCEPSGIGFDTMVGMNVAYPEFPKGLDFSNSIYTHHEYYKGEGKTWLKRDADEKIWAYNAKDMIVTPKVSRGIKKDLADKNLMEVYEKRAGRFIPIAMEMMRNRLRLDKKWWLQLKNWLEEERVRTHGNLVARIGREINVKSSPEVSKLLYEELRLPVKHQRGSAKPSTQEIFLKELRADHPSIPELNMILEERHIRTKQSNYINVSFDEGSDGELYLGYVANVSSAKTGRWAFGSSPKWRGSSPQTINKVMRLMYCPPIVDGKLYCFWQRDLSQVEARIVAWLSNCSFLLKVFASPIKIHKIVGSMIYGRPPEEIESDSQEYDISKRVVHAYDYMMTYKKFAVTANIPTLKAKKDLETYGRGVPEISDWHRQTGETATRLGQLVTPFGRIRDCFNACSAVTNTGKLPDEILRDLVSYVPQSTAPDILNESMWELWGSCDWVRWHQQGHDSWLASGPHERTQEFYERSEAAAGKVKFRCGQFVDCHVPGEFSWGYLWGAMLIYQPGENTSYEAWLERATKEKCFDEGKIRTRMLSML